MVQRELALATRAVSAGRGSGAAGDALNVPIVLASNFLAATGGDGPEYSRDDGTPTWMAFETAIGSLEGGSAVAFSSGMAAISGVLSRFGTASTVVAPDDVYTGVGSWLRDAVQRLGWNVTRVPVADTAAWVDASTDADLVWIESPSNPLLEVTDLASVIPAAKQAGAFVAVDNTFATPILQQPLRLGADVVVHSATKYIGGHADLLAGVAVTQDATVEERLRAHRQLHGATPGALEMFLALRGLRTLPLRFGRAQDNARRLVEYLQAHPRVHTVRYPTLPGGRSGFGAVISFEIDGSAADADTVCSSVRVIRPATSLGGVESTIERRAKLAGQDHLPPTLLRLAVGIEDVDDLQADLDDALRP
ncbi:MAG TPA: PLP-dependent transferase [Ilumatobacteraceae bacterium]|nr:PLP-dependent transferase [Ilumatobacteraceae bacterium]